MRNLIRHGAGACPSRRLQELPAPAFSSFLRHHIPGLRPSLDPHSPEAQHLLSLSASDPPAPAYKDAVMTLGP